MTPRLFDHFSMFGLVFFVLNSLGNCEKMESCKIRLRTVSGSLLSSDLVRGLHARASVEQQSRETRETRAAALEATPVSCRAFCSTDWEKRKTAPSVWKTCNFVAKPRSHFRILLYQTWAISHSKVTRETGSALRRIAPWDCFGEAVASFIGRLRIHLPFPRPLSPLPESHGAIRHNKAKG